MYHGLRLGVRAIIVQNGRVLLVNAYRSQAGPELWCAPGGGVEPHCSLPRNLAREVFEETGLVIDVGPVALVNEFHDPELDFHQVEVFFRSRIVEGEIDDNWQDTGAIVHKRRFFAPEELHGLPLKPSSLPRIAFDTDAPVIYDPLELLVR